MFMDFYPVNEPMQEFLKDYYLNEKNNKNFLNNSSKNTSLARNEEIKVNTCNKNISNIDSVNQKNKR